MKLQVKGAHFVRDAMTKIQPLLDKRMREAALQELARVRRSIGNGVKRTGGYLPVLFVFFWCAPAFALPPANNETPIQPSEKKNWACDYGVPVATLIDHDVILRAGSDATCVTAITGDTGKLCSPVGLITTPAISGNRATFTITPAGKTSGNVYQVTILVEDSLGQRFACDGKVTVKTVKVS